MAHFRKIKAGLVNADINQHIGEVGNIFFDIVTGEFRLSDGHTPGGIPLSGGTGGGGDTFKTFKVDGQLDLTASGADTLRFVAGTGINLYTSPSSSPKSITIESTGFGNIDGGYPFSNYGGIENIDAGGI